MFYTSPSPALAHPRRSFPLHACLSTYLPTSWSGSGSGKPAAMALWRVKRCVQATACVMTLLRGRRWSPAVTLTADPPARRRGSHAITRYISGRDNMYQVYVVHNTTLYVCTHAGMYDNIIIRSTTGVTGVTCTGSSVRVDLVLVGSYSCTGIIIGSSSSLIIE